MPDEMVKAPSASRPSTAEYDDILDGLFHNADYRIIPTETLMIWFSRPFP
jgi:hypothetical protein